MRMTRLICFEDDEGYWMDVRIGADYHGCNVVWEPLRWISFNDVVWC